MTKRLVLACVICLSAVSFNGGVTLANAQAPSSFSKDIQPILEQNCVNCHGPSMQSSRLNLSTLEGALRGGARGSAIVPGRAEDSRLYRVVAGLDKPTMPLGGNKLTDGQIAAIRNWIDQGAHWDTGAAVTAKTQPDAASAFAPADATITTVSASASSSLSRAVPPVPACLSRASPGTADSNTRK